MGRCDRCGDITDKFYEFGEAFVCWFCYQDLMDIVFDDKKKD
jgi:hypothetical protein